MNIINQLIVQCIIFSTILIVSRILKHLEFSNKIHAIGIRIFGFVSFVAILITNVIFPGQVNVVESVILTIFLLSLGLITIKLMIVLLIKGARYE